MGLTEQRYKEIREKLDRFGYRQPLSVESLLLVEHLFADLLHTTESLKHYKNIAQITLEVSYDGFLNLFAVIYGCYHFCKL